MRNVRDQIEDLLEQKSSVGNQIAALRDELYSGNASYNRNQTLKGKINTLKNKKRRIALILTRLQERLRKTND